MTLYQVINVVVSCNACLDFMKVSKSRHWNSVGNHTKTTAKIFRIK